MTSPRLLLDAGVWMAALDRADRWHAASRSIVEAAASGRAISYALDLTVYEALNVATVKWRSQDDAKLASSLIFDACPRRVLGIDPDRAQALAPIAADVDLTAYDAAYVAAAQEHDLQLVSTDLDDLVEPGLAISPESTLELLD